MIIIKSVSDVITNSSSETFIVKTDLDPKELLQELKNHAQWDRSSGMSGIIEVENRSTPGDKVDRGEYFLETPWEWIPEDSFAVTIDWGFQDCIKYLKNNTKILCSDIYDDSKWDTIRDSYYSKKSEEIMDKITNCRNKEELENYFELWETIQDLK